MNSPSSGSRWENCLVSFYQDSRLAPIRGLPTTRAQPRVVQATYYPGRALHRAPIDGKKCWLDAADFWLLRVKNDSLNIV